MESRLLVLEGKYEILGKLDEGGMGDEQAAQLLQEARTRRRR